jgi:hypothetical protein
MRFTGTIPLLDALAAETLPAVIHVTTVNHALLWAVFPMTAECVISGRNVMYRRALIVSIAGLFAVGIVFLSTIAIGASDATAAPAPVSLGAATR